MEKQGERVGNPEAAQQLARLQVQFLEIVSVASESAESAKTQELFREIAQKYQSPDRAYHNLDHVESVLQFLNQYKSTIKDWSAVQLAVWFHDVIYNTKSKDNEEASAVYAKDILHKLGLPQQTVGRVETLVLATKKHEAIAGDTDLEIFLDADLSILGESEAIYDAYATAIRQEYAWVPEDIYRQERIKILNSFLTRDRIYFNNEVNNTLQTRARQNIEREISRLAGN